MTVVTYSLLPCLYAPQQGETVRMSDGSYENIFATKGYVTNVDQWIVQLTIGITTNVFNMKKPITTVLWIEAP